MQKNRWFYLAKLEKFCAYKNVILIKNLSFQFALSQPVIGGKFSRSPDQ